MSGSLSAAVQRVPPFSRPRPCASLAAAVLVGAALLAWGAPARAQAMAAGSAPGALLPGATLAPDWSLPLTPLGALRADADADGVPPSVGAVAHVGGRVTAGTGLVRADLNEVYLQDGTGGLRLILPPGSAPVLAGDSVRVHGAVSFRHGMVEMVRPSVRVLSSPARAMRHVRLPNVRSANGGEGPDVEGHEGEAVEIRGYVLQSDSVAAGRLLVVLAETKIVQVFAYRARAHPIQFRGIGIGDYVRVRGIAAQHDLAPPFNASYVIYPLAEDAVQRAGLPPSTVRLMGLLVVAGLLLALLWVHVLRRQVARRSAALASSDARYAQLFDAAADAVFVFDLAHGGALAQANRMAQHAFGVGPDGRLAGGAARLFRDLAVDPDEAERYLAEADRTGTATDVVSLRHASGAPVPYEIATRALAGVGAARVFVAVARDVQTRQLYEVGLLDAMSEAENARQAAEVARAAAERADALKSTIFRTMSHELRTPLTAIIGFSEILVEESPAELREHAEYVRAGGEQLLRRLNDVLDLARLESAGREAEQTPPETFDAADVARSVAARYVRVAQADGVAVRFHAAEAAPLVAVRPTFERVVDVLVDNAVKFTSQGEVRVSVACVAGGVAVRVQDTGVGIEQDFLPHLFEPFRQESDRDARSHEGSGLGLAVARRIVDLAGGQIRVWSRKHEGTTFEVVMPHATATPPGGDGAALHPAAADLGTRPG